MANAAESPFRMQTRTFGSTGHAIPVVGQGTWKMERDRNPAAAITHGLDLGMTHVDTAELYGSGQVEEIVAGAIKGRRDDVYLVSKVAPQNASRAGTLRACEGSLRRLQTDRLDCYLLHWRGRHPLEETITAFQELKRTGKIGAWGVSNFDLADLIEAEKIAGPGQIACNQVIYHLQDRDIERDVVPWCEAHGVAVVGYTPFGTGSFPGPQTKQGKILDGIARTHGRTTRQVALAFLIRRPALFAIPKASQPQHVAENGAAADIRLTPAEILQIDEAFAA